MATNPFEYPEHLPFNTDYEKTLFEAARLQLAGVSYKQTLNILQQFVDMLIITIVIIALVLDRLNM